MNLSENFTLKEMIFSQTATRLDINNDPSKKVVENLKFLCGSVLQPLRDMTGTLIVSSGYRSERLNSQIGGAPKSKHIQGLAADIISPMYSTMDIIRIAIKNNISFDVIISEFSEWVHITASREGIRHKVLRAYKENGKTVYERIDVF